MFAEVSKGKDTVMELTLADVKDLQLLLAKKLNDSCNDLHEIKAEIEARLANTTNQQLRDELKYTDAIICGTQEDLINRTLALTGRLNMPLKRAK